MIYKTCPACSCAKYTIDTNGVKFCHACDAIYGEISREIAAQYVKLNKWHGGDSLDHRYFDFTFTPADSRVHGWFDYNSKAVTQFG